MIALSRMDPKLYMHIGMDMHTARSPVRSRVCKTGYAGYYLLIFTPILALISRLSHLPSHISVQLTILQAPKFSQRLPS